MKHFVPRRGTGRPPTSVRITLQIALEEAKKLEKLQKVLNMKHVDLVNAGIRMVALAAYLRGRNRPLKAEMAGEVVDVLEYLDIHPSPIEDLRALLVEEVEKTD